MIEHSDSKLLRIGVFYDGNFFFHVSNYYKYSHSKKARLSIPGLHEFIRHHAASLEGADVRFCHIVDSHFFRGRFSAKAAEAQQKLFADRVLDDILMSEGVVTHYLPIRGRGEKGIDVWLALEAFELAVYKRFDVLVIIAGDSDFVPLARKVNSLGTRVMVLGWDFKYVDEFNEARETTTSIHLLDEVTYPVLMHTVIDDKTKRDDLIIKNLFQEARLPDNKRVEGPKTSPAQPNPKKDERIKGEILTLREGYGFIRAPGFPNNVFFSWRDLVNVDFDQLRLDDKVIFFQSRGEKGDFAHEVELL